jgi:hypothetical protein
MTKLYHWLNIKQSEQSACKYLFIITFCFSICTSISRSIGMALLVGQSNESILPTVFIAIDLLVMLGAIAYTPLTQRYTASKLFKILCLYLTLLIFIFSSLFSWQQNSWFFATFFILFSALQILIFIHLTSFISSYFSSIQLRRVLPVIFSGMALGGMAGGFFILLASHILSAEYLLFFAAVPLAISFYSSHKLEQNVAPLTRQTNAQKHSFFDSLKTSFQFIRTSQLMLWSTAAVLFFMFSARLLEFYYQGIIYPQAFPDTQDRAAFFGQYEIIANISSLIIQLTFSRWLLNKFGVSQSNMVYPVLTLIAGLGLLVAPGLLMGVIAHFINQELRQSIRSPASNLLFNAIPHHLWAGCKAYLNGLIYPAATCLSAGFIMLIASHDSQLQLIPIFVAIFSLFGITMAFKMGAAYRTGLYQQLSGYTDTVKEPTEKIIINHLKSADTNQQTQALTLIRQLKITPLLYQVGQLAVNTHSVILRQHCIETLATFPKEAESLMYLLKALRYESSPNVIRKIIHSLRHTPETLTLSEIAIFLKHPDPDVFLETCIFLITRSSTNDQKTSVKAALLLRIKHSSASAQSTLLKAFKYLPSQEETLLTFAGSKHSLVRATAIELLISLDPKYADKLQNALYQLLNETNPSTQSMALKCLREVPLINDWQHIISHLKNPKTKVQKAALNVFRSHISTGTAVLFQYLLETSSPPALYSPIIILIYNRISIEQQHKLQQKSTLYWEKILTALQQNQTINADWIGFNLSLTLVECNSGLDNFSEFLTGLSSIKDADVGNALEALSQLPKHPKSQSFIHFYEEYILSQQYNDGLLFLQKNQW